MSKRNPILDLVRGVSAWVVLFGHLRSFVFVNFSALESPSNLSRVFYFLTGFGHQAVVVFFVLSGYFVGGSVLQAHRGKRFDWSVYALNRLSRLWVVLIPALVWTLAWDQWGIRLDEGAYSGKFYQDYSSGPSPAVPASHSVTTWVGNLFFLQGVFTANFGTNGPLWSLANEFWYYVIFPALLVGCSTLFKPRKVSDDWVYALLNLGGAGLLLCILPTALIQAGLIWMLGVLVWVIHQFEADQRFARPRFLAGLVSGFISRWFVLIVLLCSLVAARLGKWWGGDFYVGLFFAVWMVLWASRDLRFNWLRSFAIWISEISYSVYLFHFPFLFFVCATVMGGQRRTPGFHGFVVYGALGMLSMAVCYAAWWCFERQTPQVRAWIGARFGIR